jgi:hypothetical protein
MCDQTGRRKPKWKQLLNGNTFLSDSNGYPHIFDHARPENYTADIVRHGPTSEAQTSATKPELETGSGNNFGTETDFIVITAVTPTFSTMPDLGMALSTWPDIRGHWKLKMSAAKQALTLSTGCGFPISADVGQCRLCRTLVGYGRTSLGSRWNRLKICFPSKVFPLSVSTSGFVADISVSGVD